MRHQSIKRKAGPADLSHRHDLGRLPLSHKAHRSGPEGSIRMTLLRPGYQHYPERHASSARHTRARRGSRCWKMRSSVSIAAHSWDSPGQQRRSVWVPHCPRQGPTPTPTARPPISPGGSEPSTASRRRCSTCASQTPVRQWQQDAVNAASRAPETPGRVHPASCSDRSAAEIDGTDLSA